MPIKELLERADDLFVLYKVEEEMTPIRERVVALLLDLADKHSRTGIRPNNVTRKDYSHKRLYVKRGLGTLIARGFRKPREATLDISYIKMEIDKYWKHWDMIMGSILWVGHTPRRTRSMTVKS